MDDSQDAHKAPKKTITITRGREMNTLKQVQKQDHNYWYDEAELKEIRKVYGGNLNNIEFDLFMNLGRATGLNPYLREIWAVKYGKNVQVFVGRDGYRVSAQRHPDYECHIVEPFYEKDNYTPRDILEGNIPMNPENRGKLMGACCIVKRKSSQFFSSRKVLLKEYQKNFGLWTENEKPETMIMKVAEAHALRAAFQEIFAGTYIEEEVPEYMRGNTKQKEQIGNIIEMDIKDKKVDFEKGSNSIVISEAQLLEIERLMVEKELSIERQQKIYEHYKVNAFSEMTDAQARLLIHQLSRV